MRACVADTGTGALTHVVDVDGSLRQRFGVVTQPAFTFVEPDGTATTSRGGMHADALRAAADALLAAGSGGRHGARLRARRRVQPVRVRPAPWPISACSRPARRAAGWETRCAARFAAGMTVGFVTVFGLAGGAPAPSALSIERHLPIVTVVAGVVLVALGGWLLAGRNLAMPVLAGHGAAPPPARWRSQIGYGMSFALASLSCTIAPFLAVTAGSPRVGGPPGVTAAFLAYALGMGTVVLVLVLAVVTARARRCAGCAAPAR